MLDWILKTDIYGRLDLFCNFGSENGGGVGNVKCTW